MHRIHFLILLAATLWLCGCGGQDGNQEEEEVFDQMLFDTTVEEYNLSYGDFVESYCDCYTRSEFGGERMDCEAAHDSYFDPGLCEMEAYHAHPDRGLDFINCRRKAGENYRACLSSCPVSDAKVDCGRQVFESLETCRFLAPDDMLATIDACIDARSMMLW